MEPISIAASAVALLVPVAGKAMEAFAGEAGRVAFGKGRELLDRLRGWFADDPVSSGALDRFQAAPEQWSGALESLIAERAARDEAFARDLAGRISELENAAPDIDVVQRMQRARKVVGVHADEVTGGTISVDQQMDDAEDVTGVRLGRVGRDRERARDADGPERG